MFIRKDIPLVSLSWKEGRYFDFWMFVHVMTGIVIGLIALYFSVPFYIASWLTFIGMVVYEVIEDVFKVHEVIENRIFDVVFGMAGFLLVFQIQTQVAALGVLWVLLAAVIVLSLLSFFGWLSWMRRTNRIPFLNHRIHSTVPEE